MKKEEIQKRMLSFNRAGAIMKCKQTPNCDPWTALLDSSLTVVRVEGDAWWLSWRDAWFINGSTPGHLVKVVQTTVEDSREDERDGEQWGEVLLVDDTGASYKIEILIPVTDRGWFEAWKEWDSYRNKNRERMAGVDKVIIEAHTRHALEWSR